MSPVAKTQLTYTLLGLIAGLAVAAFFWPSHYVLERPTPQIESTPAVPRVRSDTPISSTETLRVIDVPGELLPELVSVCVLYTDRANHIAALSCPKETAVTSSNE